MIDDNPMILQTLKLLLKRTGHSVIAVSTPDDALQEVRRNKPDLIISDMNFSNTISGDDGLELLQKFKILSPDTPVILITAWGSIPLAVEGMRHGAFDFITKPWDNLTLLQKVETALAINSREQTDNSAEFDRCGIVGNSVEMNQILDTVRKVAPTNASVLILGENGTGKEMVAKAIHENSRRRNEKFVMVNLGGISQSLFESEMFGHAKGAYTGAISARKGRFEIADKGTIFLDEIGDLDLNCQVKLLRVLQEHTFEPLGESRPRKVDVRVVSATNADLTAMVANRTFREDLFYRINLITLRLPALRERRDDIPLLVNHFLEKTCKDAGINIPHISSEAMTFLTSLPYPGNIRELKNTIERAVIVSQGNTLSKKDFEFAERETSSSSSTTFSPSTLDEMERLTIKKAMEQFDGNFSKVAISLGITRQALYRRLKKYGMIQ